jgi:hypothetical protein
LNSNKSKTKQNYLLKVFFIINKKALEIYKNFIEDGSDNELNIKKRQVQEIEKLIFQDTDEITKNIFDKIDRDVEFVLIDTFSRFLVSDHYQNYLNEEDLQKKKKEIDKKKKKIENTHLINAKRSSVNLDQKKRSTLDRIKVGLSWKQRDKDFVPNDDLIIQDKKTKLQKNVDLMKTKMNNFVNNIFNNQKFDIVKK